MTGAEHEALIADGLRAVWPTPGVREIRIPNTREKTVSGFFDDPHKAAKAIVAYDRRDDVTGIYDTLNPTDPSLLRRATNRLKPFAAAGTLTGDKQIARREFLPVDCDPVRDAHISSTDEQHDAAIARAKKIAASLTADFGFPEPTLSDSGNGGHLLYRINLPNDAESKLLVEQCLAALDLRFTDGFVKVDQSVANAARIWKVYGSMTRKGDEAPDAPHRRARVLSRPLDQNAITTLEQLQRLAASAPAPEPPSKQATQSGFDLAGAIDTWGLAVRFSAPWNGGQKWVLETCPFDSSHTGGCAVVMQHASGAADFRCLHESCKRYRWPELRAKFEPKSERRRPTAPSSNGKTHAAPSPGLDDEPPAEDPLRLDEPIDVTEIDLPKLTAQAIAALVKTNEPPFLFRQLGNVVRVDLDEEQRPIIKGAGVDVVRHAMSISANWTRTRGSGKSSRSVSTEPPRVLVENLLATPELPFPGLRGITTAPYFTAHGALVVSPGYNPVSRLYLMQDASLVVPAIPRAPTGEHVARAVATIDDIFADLPFVALADRAHTFALLLLPFVREMILGPTPLHLSEAPDVGTGKTLLVQAALLPACGTRLQLDTFGRDEEERQKFILSALLAGRPAIVYDNVEGRIKSAVLAGVLTATRWGGRVLGASHHVDLPNRATWVATTNNASLSTEIARRSIPIRIDAGVERPFARDVVYRHPALLEYELEHRGTIVAAALTIVQAWIAAGKPPARSKLGSYEAWSNVVGGALTFAGVEGFLGNLSRLFENADDAGEALRAFVDLWADRHGNHDVRAPDLVPLAEEASIDLGRDDRPARKAKMLGIQLRANRDRVFGAHRIERRKLIDGNQRWGLTDARRGRPPAPNDRDANRFEQASEDESSGTSGTSGSVSSKTHVKTRTQNVYGFSGNDPTDPPSPTPSTADDSENGDSGRVFL